jgi:hypothetical protein
MKIYRTFVRASHRDMKGVDLTDREVSDYIGTVRIESQFQVNALAPFLSDYAERLKAYNQKKRAQAAANVRWSKNQKKTV